jgi:pimeloyl-ACP methyl ester carboxylesterase
MPSMNPIPLAGSHESIGRAPPAWKRPAPTELDLGHSKLAYWRMGSGPDLVFVHGWPLHSATFRHIVPLLADSFTCHLLDLPGAGRSTSTAPITFAGHVATLREAIERIGLSRYAFVAHDSGAVIARYAAVANPAVAGLVIGGTESPGHHPWLVRLLHLTSKLPFGAWIVRRILKSPTLYRSPLGFRAMFADLAYIEGDFYDLFVGPLCASLDRQLEPVRTFHWSLIDRLSDVHSKITAPVHLIWGSDDGMFPIGRARHMVTQFPGGATIAEIPHAKAWAHEERPHAFVEHAKPFLLRVLGPESLAATPERRSAMT